MIILTRVHCSNSQSVRVATMQVLGQGSSNHRQGARVLIQSGHSAGQWQYSPRRPCINLAVELEKHVLIKIGNFACDYGLL